MKRGICPRWGDQIELPWKVMLELSKRPGQNIKMEGEGEEEWVEETKKGNAHGWSEER